MKKTVLLALLLVAAIFSSAFWGKAVAQSQAKAASVEDRLTSVSEKLEQIESQLNQMLVTQQEILEELKRNRYFTKRS
ncbi:MAG: hypothetical protein HY586_02900 [Candidatus Omnitrophica bacterium]|nr:hypothetical protein [Candidatus Omnitrophota bacterium]